MSSSRRDALEEVLSVVSVILVTAEELQTLTGVEGIDEGCEWLFKTYESVQWVAVKLGSEGVLQHLLHDTGSPCLGRVDG